METQILAIDDEPLILHALRATLEKPGQSVLPASTGWQALRLFHDHRPDLVLLDLNLPDQPGQEVFRQIHRQDPSVPVIFMTGNGTASSAIEAIQMGAFDYLVKPLDARDLRMHVSRALRIRQEGRRSQAPELPPEPSTEVLIGRSPLMQEVYKAIGLAAPQDLTVLILGESGTGKDLIARTIHQYSRRSTGPFLAINCAAIPENLLESELFGHEKGAFTSADRQHIGKFEQCCGGTLFLDEVGDMPPLTQAKLLRVLQEQRFERVGGKETIHTNTRIIAATNQPLEEMVAAGKFRQDLFYRLSVFSLALPALRDRTEDLALLVNHFVAKFSREMGKNVNQVAPETMDLFHRHSWPGNLRELQSVLKQGLLRARGSVLLPEFLPASLAPAAKVQASTSPFPGVDQYLQERLKTGSEKLHSEVMGRFERHLLTTVLRETFGNQVQAARILGITRTSLRFKMQTHGLPMGRNAWSRGTHIR